MLTGVDGAAGLGLFDLVEETAPADAFVPAHPDEGRFADDMIFGYESPETGILRVVAVVAHHPIVVPFESILCYFFAIEVVFSVLLFEVVVFVGADDSFVDRIIFRREGDGRARPGQEDGTEIVDGPME
jgi:hypothetical protein